MNERIKELAEQAREYADSIYVAPGSDNTWGIRFQKKFAELIVEECTFAIDEQCSNSDAEGTIEAITILQKLFRS